MTNEVGLPTHHDRAWGYLDSELLVRILGGFARKHALGEPLCLSQIVAVMSRGDRPPPEAIVTRHVLWLLKYDFVEQKHD